jgi:hypothetical protein
MNDVRMYLLYKRKINAKIMAYGHQTLKKGVAQLREKRNQKRYQLLKADHNPCCRSGMFIPDTGYKFFYPGSRLKMIPDPDPHQRILNIFKPKHCC